MRKLTTLVTSVGSAAGQGVVRALRSSDAFRVIGIDAQREHGGLGLADKDEMVPLASDPQYIPRIVDLIRNNQADFVIPVMEPELIAFSKFETTLTKTGIPTVWTTSQGLDCSLSKRKLVKKLEALDIATPRVVPAIQNYLPFFLRPDCGTGSQGSKQCNVLEDIPANLEGLLATQVVEGLEFSVDAFAWPPGNLVNAICRQRQEVRGGLSVRSVVVDRKPIWDNLVHLTHGLNLRGLFNIQFINDSCLGPAFFDLNTRPGGAMTLSFQSGLDLPHYLRSIALGRPFSGPETQQVGNRLFRRWEDVVLPGHQPQ